MSEKSTIVQCADVTNTEDQRTAIIDYFHIDHEFEADRLLCISAIYGQSNIVQELILNGQANINAEDEEGRTSLILALLSYRKCLRYINDEKRRQFPERFNEYSTICTQSSKDVPMSKQDIDTNFEKSGSYVFKNFEIVLEPNDAGTTITFTFKPFHNDQKVHAFEDCILFLISNGANINVTDEAENTPLVLAADLGLENIVQGILSSNQECNIHYSNIYRETALHKAAENHHYQIIKFLMDAGANFTSKTNDFYGGDTPLQCMIRNVHNVFESDPDSSERKNVIFDIIQKKEEQYSTVEQKWELVSKSVYHGDIQTLRILINFDFSLEYVSEKNETALGIAVKNNQLSIVELLLSKGANPNIKSHGRGLLETAVMKNNFDIIKLLIQFGAASESTKHSINLVCLSLESDCFDIADLLFMSGFVSVGECQKLLSETGETSVYRKWLSETSFCPLPLKYLTRKTILGLLRGKPNQRKVMAELNIPKCLKYFLQLNDLTKNVK